MNVTELKDKAAKEAWSKEKTDQEIYWKIAELLENLVNTRHR